MESLEKTLEEIRELQRNLNSRIEYLYKFAKGEILFNVVDYMTKNYTWEYTTKQKAIALLDINFKSFVMISERREIADETGAMGDYRDTTWYLGYLYSKEDPQPTQATYQFSKEPYLIESSSKSKEDLISLIEKKTGSYLLKEIESINLNIGKVYILEGNLVLDRK
ncbi:MAG: hypothetical protein WC413_02515 [Candidatus Nanoarchaeia archaeon]